MKTWRKDHLNELATKAKKDGAITPQVFAQLTDGKVSWRDSQDAQKCINDFVKAHPGANDAALNAYDLREFVRSEAYLDAPAYDPHKLKIQLSLLWAQVSGWANPGALDRTFGKP
jgi:hypothetical protein